MPDRLLLLLLVLIAATTLVNSAFPNDPEGPRFIVEPRTPVDFSNNTGVRLDCVAKGNPTPTVKWLHSDGSAVEAITRLRHILTNGSLLLLPFRAEEYRQDVHATVYKCQAVNGVGILVSRDIRIRAVVVQDYEVQVYDEFVIAGNTAIMKCQIPSFVADYVSVESWLRDTSFIIYPSYDNDGKYFVLPTGELQIQEVRASDGLFTYRCRTVHQLTGDTRLSATSGRLFVTEPHGTVPPRIAESKVSVTVKEGEIAVLPCSAQAFPIPTYGWFQRSDDGRTVPLSFGLGKMMLIGGNLIIKNAEINDRGVFVCIVQNPVGNERVEVYLGITATLTAVIRPTKLQLDMCQEAVFQCWVTGFPITSQIWLKDGQPLSSDSDTTVSQELVRIPCVTKKHRGIYQCIVNNDIDCVQASAELLLGDIPPSITHIFSEETIYPNRQISLQCIATGSPPPQVNWMVDDVAVPKLPKFRTSSFSTEDGNVISFLNISQAQTKDGGRYACVATNKAGKAEKSSRVNVFGMPFIRQMTRKSVVAGDTIIIHCPFGGYPIENIVWEKGGLRLPLNHLQVVFPNGTLKLQSVQRAEDAGAYTCIIHNKEGQTARQDLELMVMVPPKINPSSFQDTRLHEGSHARIICAVVEGDLPIAFTWLKERRAIPSELGIAIRDFDEFSSVLTISKASTEHGGNYTCVARNAAASDSYTALITVNVPPRWIVQPQDVTTFPGLKIVINCQATGSPLPSIKWLKAVDGSPGEYEELRGNDLSLRSLENGSLVLESAKEEHDGRYLCRASNGVGNGLSKVVNVDVRVPVRFDIKFANVTVRKDEDAKLICTVKGDRPIRISWSRHQQRLNPSSDSRLSIQETQRDGKLVSELTIRNVQREDSSVFFCLAQNTFGKDEAQTKLIIIESPEPPKDLLLVDHSSRSVTISWNSPFDGNVLISHFVIQLKKNADPWQRSQNTTVSSKELTASIEDLFPSITYQCRVFAINTVGVSNPSESLTFTTLEEAPGGPPLFVHAEVKENELVKVTWKPPKKELWNGNIRGYYVGYKVHDSSEPYSFVTVDVVDASNNDLSVNLEALRPFTKYSIIVQAFNHIGTSPRSQEINVLTSEDAPSLPPMNVQCAPFLRDSLQVSWDPPPESSFNGILQGYKVISTPDDEWYDADALETKVTTGSNTILSSLLKFTNYSIQVVAFTRVGDGPKSEAVYCNTNEDVPEAPSDIKVISTAVDSVLIAWKPPIRPNGIIKRYTLYKRGLEKDKEDIVKHVLPSTETTFEAKNLVKDRRYEFWVTASTTVGEGQSTPVVSITKSEHIVPAKLISFGGVINAPWKSSLDLPCKAIGIPPPETKWKFQKLKPTTLQFHRFLNGAFIFFYIKFTLF